VRLTRLLETSTFRLTLAHLGLFVGSALALLALVYFASVRFMERQTIETIEVEMAALLDRYAERGLPGLRAAVARRAQDARDLASVYLLLGPGGQQLAGSFAVLDGPLPEPGAFGRAMVEEWTEDGRRSERPFLVLRRDLMLGGTLVVGRDIAEKLHIQRLLLTAIGLGGGLMAVLGLVGGIGMSRWMLGRLDRVNRATREIMAGDLGRRIEERGSGDEFDELARNLNAMLERIERLVAGMRQVSDNVAHDLRTPLHRIRSRLEVALMGRPDEAQTRELLEQTLRDADALIATFNALLKIARIEAEAPQGEWERVDLAALASEVFELYEPLAADRQIALRLEAPAPAEIRGNRQLIAQALANIVDNAIKYTPEGGAVAIRAGDGAAPRLEVLDSGPGIPPELRQHALERFVRLDPDRSTPGNGLGLSLVDAVARLHEAELELADNSPGLRVTMRFRNAAAHAGS
jgi:signal transduction histidine kinase